MKGLVIPNDAKEIFNKYLNSICALQEDKDAEIDEFMEEHAESKFKATLDLKKKYTVKVALATKDQDLKLVAQLNE
jgi:hypothetical protein